MHLKKVLYISPNGYLGGAERFVLTAVKAHSERNKIDASILFFSDGEACDEARSAGLKIYILKQSFRFRHPWNLLRALLEIRSLVKKIAPDILHLTMPYSHIVLSLATFGLSMKKVWFQHGPVEGRLDQLANLFPVDMILYNCLDLQVRHHRAWPKAHVRMQEVIVHYGVQSRNESHILFQNSLLTLGAAGRICSWKGFHHVLMALGELKKEINMRPFKLLIAGSAKKSHDQEYKKKLVDLTRTYNLTNEVEFLEHQKNMEEFYHKIDIFIHSSVIAEPFGLVVAEAMLNGCLVIASDSGGVKDLIQNGMTGFNFPATSDKAVSELKKVLNTFLNANESFSEQHYQSIANQGKNFVAQNYTVEKMTDQLESLYLKF